MKRLKRSDIDTQKWDAMVRETGGARLFSYSWYLDVCTNGQWEALIADDYRAGFPLPVNYKAGISYLYLPFFVRQLNPLGECNAEDINKIYKCLQEDFKRVHVGLPSLDTFESSSRQIVHQELIAKNYDEIARNYSNNVKRLLKKSDSKDLKFNVNAEPETLVKGFSEGKGKQIEALGKDQFSTLTRLMNECLKRGHGHCLSVTDEDGLEAIGFFMVDTGRVIFLKSHANEAAKKAGLSVALMDFAIKRWGIEKGIFDFGGSRISGVAQFYKKFGAIDAFYLLLSYDRSPLYYKGLRRFGNWVKPLVKNLRKEA